ncbi:MAG TPA: signal peptidase I [Gaiellaceae bacterium]
MRRIFGAVRSLAATVLLALAVAYVGLIVFGYEPMAMKTGSMRKTIPVGSLVVDRPVAPSSLRVGDVISFRKPIGEAGIDTHRIIEIQRSSGHVVYRTKGDSNPVPDPWAIQYERHMEAHRMIWHVPYLGYALLFAHSRLGAIILISYVCLSLAVTVLKVIAGSAQPRSAARSS